MGVFYTPQPTGGGTSITDWAEGLEVVSGSYYQYDNVLYQANTDHTATATFDVTKFDAISVGEEAPTTVSNGTTNLNDKQKNVKANATSGDAIINLPTAVGKLNDTITITKTDSSANTVQINPDGSETISGESSITLYYQYQSAVLISDGANWFVLSEASNDFAKIVAGTTAPTDTTLYWLDTN